MLLQLTIQIVIVLTITVVMLSLFAVLARLEANRREALIGAQRAAFLDAIRAFLAGVTQLEDVARAAPRRASIGLGALVSAAAESPQDQLPRLRVLIDHLGLHQADFRGLRSRDWTRRAHAATRLGILRVPAAVPLLVNALDDAMLDVRLAAAHALAQLQATDAVEPILRSLALPMSWPLQRCAEILHEMGHGAIEPLLAAQKGGRLPVAGTTVVVKVLGMLRAMPAVATITTTLQHPDDEIRVASAKALGEIGDARAVAALRTALKDKAWPVRSAAAKSLGHLSRREAIPDLAEVLADSAWWVRFNAAEALYRLGATSTLRETLANHGDRFARDISRQVLEQFNKLQATGVMQTAPAIHATAVKPA
jgi:HEAT repeat protein